MNPGNLALYLNFVSRRHEIWEARQAGRPQPWTEDPVLASRKFTNVFRVLDPGSQFIFELDNDDPDPHDIITRLVLYRITNLPSTWEFVRAAIGRYPTVEDILEMHPLVGALKAYRDAGNKVFSGAYIIIPEPGTANDKIEGAVRVTRRFVTDALPDFMIAQTQEQRFQALSSTPGIGKFLAMQVLTDWGYLQLENPEGGFIVAGPGARRGAAHLSELPAEEVIEILTSMWENRGDVNVFDHTPSLMDVQNTLCEFSKYHRFTVGGKVFRPTPYRPAHPGPQPFPLLPAWMR